MRTTLVAPDDSMAVDIDHAALWAMLDLCAKSVPLETGGVLLGSYTEFGDRAVVSSVVGPPSDSRHDRFGFLRGIAGLTARFRRAWERGEYYLGEWHFHPLASSIPSPQDRKQIVAFSHDIGYRCPHPLLIVIGGEPPIDWTLTLNVVMGADLVTMERLVETMPVGSARSTSLPERSESSGDELAPGPEPDHARE